MVADAHDMTSSEAGDDPSLAGMLDVFRRGSQLVDAALSTLGAIAPKIEALKLLVAGADNNASLAPQVGLLVFSLGRMLDIADPESDNLLLTPKGHAPTQPLVVFTLARQTSGTLCVQSIEIDRAAIAFSDGGLHESNLAFDRLFRAALDLANPELTGARGSFRAALDTFLSHTTFAGSRLSIAKARFDLQSSFLNAITQAEDGSSIRLEGHLDGTGARDMAMETRRLLSRQSMNIANGNRETLHELLRKHAAKTQS